MGTSTSSDRVIHVCITCDPQKCNHVKPTALRREEKIASIDIAQSPGLGRAQQPPLHAACPLPVVKRRTEGHRAGPRHRGTRRRCPGLLEEGRGPPWRPGTHTLRGSIPGADDGREEPSPGGGGAGSKPFTAPLWKKVARPDLGHSGPLLFITPQLTLPGT